MCYQRATAFAALGALACVGLCVVEHSTSVSRTESRRVEAQGFYRFSRGRGRTRLERKSCYCRERTQLGHVGLGDDTYVGWPTDAGGEVDGVAHSAAETAACYVAVDRGRGGGHVLGLLSALFVGWGSRMDTAVGYSCKWAT